MYVCVNVCVKREREKRDFQKPHGKIYLMKESMDGFENQQNNFSL